ncbi:MAG TPA: CmpA/NrtA family ABC transporter substrate-binding protein [Opitutaceae bacterium]
MTSTLSSTSAQPGKSARPLRVGFISLTDSAPLVVAQELGYFQRHGVRVELKREIGWATIREKIIYGELDLTHAPAPMLWSTQLGLGCRQCDVLCSFVLNLHGNAITLSKSLWDAGVRDPASLREYAKGRPAQSPLTLGAVFVYSSHNLLLRDWCRGAGLDPDRDMRIVVVPPAQMFRNLAAGTIDGYCVGEPWGSLAVREGAGWCPTWSAAQQPGHIEKVIMLTQRFAETRAAEHAAFLRALAEAACWCDEPQNRERLADILSDQRYLNLPARVIAPALSGHFDCGHGRVENISDFILFHHNEANVPSVEKALGIQRALAAAHLLPATAAADTDLPRRLFREDLHREILKTTQLTA